MKILQVAVNFTVPDHVQDKDVTDFVDGAITEEASRDAEDETHGTAEWMVDSAAVIMRSDIRFREYASRRQELHDRLAERLSARGIAHSCRMCQKTEEVRTT